MTKMNLNIHLASPMELSKGIDAAVFPLLNQAVRAVAQQTAINWQKKVYAGKMWSGEKDAYAKSIDWKMTGDFSAEVEATYKHAEQIESGRPPYDLKKMLDTSLKVRRTKTGKRFLVIPMRHNTPGNGALAPDMPQGVYDLVKAMTASSVVGQGQRPSGEVTHLSPATGMQPAAKQTPYLSNPKTRGAMQVNRNKYEWGKKLTASMLKNAGLNPGQHRNLIGTYRFKTSTPGGASSSAYLSFRIMMDGQTGWVIPARPGQHLARQVVDEMRPKATQAFEAAVTQQFKKGG